MTHNQQTLQIADLHYLEDQYPLIHRIVKQLNLEAIEKLRTLVQVAKYNVPKDFYSDDVKELDYQIQEICMRYNERSIGEEDVILIPEEMRKNQSAVSDQEEAKETLQRKDSLTSEAKKLSICEIQRMIANFKLASDLQLVNPEIIRGLNEFSTCKKQKGVIQKGDLKQKPEWKKTVSKAYSVKSKDSTPVSIQKKQKTDIIITIGNNVPIEVRQMRNNVKVKSQNSFAITSQVEQGKKTDIQKQKTHISLSLNKVAEDNAQEIFEELRELVIKSKELGIYFVQELLKKCLNQFKMIQNYLNFFCLFTKISEKSFQWHWGNSQSKKITCIHRVLIEKLQNVFSEAIESKTETKKLKFMGKIIGTLINKKKISRQVYLKINNTVLSKLLVLKKENQDETYQNYFECQIELIDSMKNTFDQIWQQNPILKSLNGNVISQLKSKCNLDAFQTMEEVLVSLQKVSQFPTARIKCLISNLFQRRAKKETKVTDKYQQKPFDHQPKQNFVNHAKSLLEKDDGIKLCLQYFENNSSFDVLNEVILKICGGKSSEIESKVKQFIEYSKISNETFSNYWQEEHINFVFQQCDFPFMTSVFALLFVHNFDRQASEMVIQVSNDNEDFEDIEYFMQKLEKKIDHYIESGETAVFH